MATTIRIVHRFSVSPETLHQIAGSLERTEDTAWITRSHQLRKHTLRGVPGKLIDIWTPDERPNPVDGWITVVEIAKKLGRFDHAERVLINVRPWWAANKTWQDADGVLHKIEPGSLQVVLGNDLAAVCCRWGESGSWSRAFPRLKSDLAGYDLAAIVMWHHSRYYQIVPYDDARLLADSFAASHPELASMTLAEANRLASRDLYRLARDLGWRKLTQRERNRLGVDCMWIRTEEVERILTERVGNSAGVGDYTADAARGRRLAEIEQDGFVMTAHGPVPVE